jgi:hypothetical protein
VNRAPLDFYASRGEARNHAVLTRVARVFFALVFSA